jgi:hypothetical protein
MKTKKRFWLSLERANMRGIWDRDTEVLKRGKYGEN